MHKTLLYAAMILGSSVSGTAAATDPASERVGPSNATLERLILDRAPVRRVESIDHDRITAKRIDIVGDDGVIRMTLSGKTPAPILDGIQYRRIFDVAGLMLYDAQGNERGGLGVADLKGDSAVTFALDHPAQDAIGWRVSPDGDVSFLINQAPELVREPSLGNRLIPGVPTSTRIKLNVAANGTPTIALADADNRPRVRMTVTEEGYGAIEFLNASGAVIHTFAPEADLKQ